MDLHGFGWSTGDVITVVSFAIKIVGRCRNAPEQFGAISQEVRSLAIILQRVTSHGNISDDKAKDLRVIGEGCQNVLETLYKKLDEFQELSSDPHGSQTKRFSIKIRTGWKRLKWDEEDIKQLRDRIATNIGLLNTFYTQLNSQITQVTKEGVDRLNRHQDDQERQAIIDWLTLVNYANKQRDDIERQQRDFIGIRQQGTGQWLLDSSEFRDWLDRSGQTLFCPGVPGSGKTMMTSIVVEHVTATFQNDPRIGIAYLYCNYKRQHEQKLIDLFASLLKQLVQKQTFVPESMKSLYEQHRDKRNTLTSQFKKHAKLL